MYLFNTDHEKVDRRLNKADTAGLRPIDDWIEGNEEA